MQSHWKTAAVTTPVELARRWRPGRRVDLLTTLSPMRRGSGDPTFRVDASGAVSTFATLAHSPQVITFGSAAMGTQQNLYVSLDSTSRSKTPPFPNLKESPPLDLSTNAMPSNKDFLRHESNEFLGELNQLHQSLNQLELQFSVPNDNAFPTYRNELHAIEKVLTSIDPSTQPIQ